MILGLEVILHLYHTCGSLKPNDIACISVHLSALGQEGTTINGHKWQRRSLAAFAEYALSADFEEVEYPLGT